jgi:restriction system protein
VGRVIEEIPVNLASNQFEIEVKKLIEESGIGLSEFKTQRLEKIAGPDGAYEIDITARFEALGTTFLVLVECKHHKYPIKREVVQILYDRIRATGAHKGMIFATTTFQKGAIEYAQKHGIALIQIADGKTSCLAKNYRVSVPLPPWIPPYVGWVVTLNEDGNETYSLIDGELSRALLGTFLQEGS